jgi:hypothetical protein
VFAALLGGYGPCFLALIMANRNDSTERDPEQGPPRELEDQDLDTGAGDDRGQPGGPGWDKNIGPMGIVGRRRGTTIHVSLPDENDTSEEDEPGEHKGPGAP